MRSTLLLVLLVASVTLAPLGLAKEKDKDTPKPTNVAQIGNVLTWMPPREELEGADYSYVVFGVMAGGAETRLFQVPSYQTWADVPPGFDKYGVATSIKGKESPPVLPCVTVDPLPPDVQTSDDCMDG